MIGGVQLENINAKFTTFMRIKKIHKGPPAKIDGEVQ